MRKFEMPELMLHKWEAADIICTSNGLQDDGVIEDTSSDTPFIPET